MICSTKFFSEECFHLVSRGFTFVRNVMFSVDNLKQISCNSVSLIVSVSAQLSCEHTFTIKNISIISYTYAEIDINTVLYLIMCFEI